jgi:TolA-binding protein
VALACVATAAAAAHAPQAAEDVARRQLESGRAFARQGNYDEAIRDFQAVAETHAATSVADDAWLELARYYIDVAGDQAQAQAAVDAILANYATSDSAPSAYVLAGRLAMARSRQSQDLEAALANFDRVSRLFPASDAVPDALRMAGLAQFHAGRLDEALASLGRVTSEYSAHPAAAEAYLTAARVLMALGTPGLALEELQQVRNRFPDSPSAATALERLTLLHRLYIRAEHGPAYRASSETAGPARLENVVGMQTAADGRVIWAAESGLGAAAPQGAAQPQYVGRARGAGLDAEGRVIVIEGNVLRTASGEALMFAAQQGSSLDALDRIVAAGQLSNGQWVIMDNDARSLHRFAPDATHLAPFESARVTRLAVSETDRIAGIDRDGQNVFVFDVGGVMVSQVQLRTETYDLRDAEDVKFDVFGHLYVLDREALAVFTPDAGAGSAPGRVGYRLLTVFSVPEGQAGRFDRATAFAVDGAGAVFLYDDRNKRIQVYR